MENKERPLTEGHRGHPGGELIKKGYQGGDVVNIVQPVVSDPRGGTPAASTPQTQDSKEVQ